MAGNRPGPNPTIPCGTVTAYKRHLRNKQTPCYPCKDAWAAYQKARYDARRASQGIVATADVAGSDESGVGSGEGRPGSDSGGGFEEGVS